MARAPVCLRAFVLSQLSSRCRLQITLEIEPLHAGADIDFGYVEVVVRVGAQVVHDVELAGSATRAVTEFGEKRERLAVIDLNLGPTALVDEKILLIGIAGKGYAAGGLVVIDELFLSNEPIGFRPESLEIVTGQSDAGDDGEW